MQHLNNGTSVTSSPFTVMLHFPKRQRMTEIIPKQEQQRDSPSRQNTDAAHRPPHPQNQSRFVEDETFGRLACGDTRPVGRV